jgi:hypothetical protein
MDDLPNSNLNPSGINDTYEVQNRIREIQCAISGGAITIRNIQNMISEILIAF